MVDDGREQVVIITALGLIEYQIDLLLSPALLSGLSLEHAHNSERVSVVADHIKVDRFFDYFFHFFKNLRVIVLYSSR